MNPTTPNPANSPAGPQRIRLRHRCICRIVTSRVDGLTYRLSAVDNAGNPAVCLAHGRRPRELWLRRLQRRNNTPKRRR